MNTRLMSPKHRLVAHIGPGLSTLGLVWASAVEIAYPGELEGSVER